jgi:hypothetical protein
MNANNDNKCADTPALPAMTPDAFTYCAPYSPIDYESCTLLEPYIRRAEELQSIKPVNDASIFSQAFTAPCLHSGKPNRILVFLGCFTPPHLGHLELLAHTFLRTDGNTIAAMFIVFGDGVSYKLNGMVKGKRFKLTRAERIALLHDEVLERFSWVYRGADHETVEQFQRDMTKLAKNDGYRLEFTGLDGSDHWDLDTGHYGLRWGTGSSITTDITRPSVLTCDGQDMPPRLEGCGEWKKILPGKKTSGKGVDCWACWKFQMLCPEFVGEGIVEREYLSVRLQNGVRLTFNQYPSFGVSAVSPSEFYAVVMRAMA